MILISFLIAIVSISLSAWIDWKHRSPFFMLWPLSFLFFYIPLLFYWFEGGYSRYTIFEAFLYSSLCNLFYFFGVLISVRVFSFKGLTVTGLNLKPTKAKDLFIIIGIFAIPAILIINGVSLERILSSTLADKRELSYWYLISVLIASFVIPQAVYSVKNKKKLLTLGVVGVLILVSLYFRSRSMLVLFCLPAGYYLLMFTKSGGFKLFIMGLIAFFLSVFLKVIRYQGELRDGLNLSNWNDSFYYIMNEQFSSGDFSISKVFLSIIEDCSAQSWCGSFSFFAKFLSNFGLFSKERTVEYQLYDYYVTSGVGGSLHPTSYGFSYADFGGFLGAMFFLLLALYRVLVDKFLMGSPRNFAYVGFVMYFVLFFSRGSVYNGFMLLSVALLFEFLVSRGGLFLIKRRLR